MGTFKVFDRAASKPELVEVARTKTRDCCEKRKKNDIKFCSAPVVLTVLNFLHKDICENLYVCS